MQDKSPTFDDLVTAEAGIRMESANRRQYVMLSKGPQTVQHWIKNPDAGASRADVRSNLLKTFLDIYDYAYQDSAQHHNSVRGAAINTDNLSQDQVVHIRSIFDTFVNENYDAHGNPTLNPKNAPEAMLKLYNALDAAPLPHSELARGQLFVEMGRSDKWKPLFPRGIDFTRGEPQMDEAGKRKPTQQVDLAQRFHDAFEAADHAPCGAPPYKALPESFIAIGGLSFATKSGADGRHTHLVTQAGHVVDLTDKLKANIAQQVAAGTPVDKLKVAVKSALRLGDYAPPSKTGKAREERSLGHKIASKIRAMPKREKIDGLPAVDADGKALLMCMDIDFLTGLCTKPGKERDSEGNEKEIPSELARLKSFMAGHGCKGGFADLIPESFFRINICALPMQEEREQKAETLAICVKEKLNALADTARAENNPGMAALIERATPHLQTAMPRIYVSADKQFIVAEDLNKIGSKRLKLPAPELNKRMYMSMGGTASGKGGIKNIAEKECDKGKSLVTASLDDARSECDKYWLYAATNNHNDDYKSVEQYGNTIRDLITKRAFQGGYNLLIDGSGVPYEDRNDKIVEQFKRAGYNTSVFAVQLPFYIDSHIREGLLKDGQTLDDATYRMENRLAESQRGLIFRIVADKHIGFALASRNAARDPNVDRYMVLDSSMPKGRAHSLSYVLTLPAEQMKKLVQLSGPALKRTLMANSDKLVPDTWVTLPDDNANDYNLKVVRDNGDGTYRVEIITDMEKYVAMVQKGLLKRKVDSPDALYDNAISCDVPGHFLGKNGRLHLRQPKDLVLKDIPRYQKLMVDPSPHYTR